VILVFIQIVVQSENRLPLKKFRNLYNTAFTTTFYLCYEVSYKFSALKYIGYIFCQLPAQIFADFWLHISPNYPWDPVIALSPNCAQSNHMNWGHNVEITFIRRIITTYKRNLNKVIPLCIDSIYSLYYIYFSQHNYIIKA